jgi:predicted GTPase
MSFTVKVSNEDTTNMIGAGIPDADLKKTAFEYDDLQWDSVMAVLASKGATYWLSKNGSEFVEHQA